MTIPILATIVRALWLIVEYPYRRRFKVKPLNISPSEFGFTFKGLPGHLTSKAKQPA